MKCNIFRKGGKVIHQNRDYAYGAAMLTLRTAIGLTQDGLARYLGVSRRAVGDWETGNSYPKVHHLKELIALGMKSRAFTEGSETKEIRALWKVARQKVLLDEGWLSALLSRESESRGPSVLSEFGATAIDDESYQHQMAAWHEFCFQRKEK